MKVSGAMSKNVEYVTVDTTVRDVFRLIFGRGIKGIPVCKGKKVIGFVAERDILDNLFPVMQESLKDSARPNGFEKTEERISKFFALNVEKIMSKNPKVITADASLLKAQSVMFVEKVSILPVVD